MSRASRQLKKVLIVCTGNTCRSPMAAGWLNKKLAGSRWGAESAGLGAWNGSPATPEAIEAMQEVGVDISAHASRRLTEQAIAEVAMILAMTRRHVDEIVRRFPQVRDRVFLVGGFGPGPAEEVEDPIALPLDAYRHTRDQLIRALGDFLLHLAERGELRS